MDQLLPNMEQITYNDCKETLHMDTYLENNKKNNNQWWEKVLWILLCVDSESL